MVTDCRLPWQTSCVVETTFWGIPVSVSRELVGGYGRTSSDRANNWCKWICREIALLSLEIVVRWKSVTIYYSIPQKINIDYLFCSGENWRVLEGAAEGQTQLDTPEIGSVSTWNHPLDVHFATRGLQGWPQIQLQIYHLDSYSRTNLVGYASASLPTRPGIHYIDAPAWRPLGWLSHFFFLNAIFSSNQYVIM